jgi:hypothetical protein
MVDEMNRASLSLLLTLICTTAWGQYPIYPAFPQPPAPSAYAPYSSFYESPLIYPRFLPARYSPDAFGVVPFGGVNLLPPNPPSPYYVTPSGKEYLEQIRRKEAATYSQLKFQHHLQKWGDTERTAKP